MTKKFNDFKNRKNQKYINKARKELKDEGLLTDNEFTNVAKIITRTYIIFATEMIATQIKKEYKKLFNKTLPKKLK